MRDKGREYTQITSLLSTGRIEHGAAAIEDLKSTMRLPVLLECLGNLHFYKRELQGAITKYEEAMAADPAYDVARYHYLIGTQQERKGELMEAFRRYQAAIEIEPTFVDAYVELGGLLVKVKDYAGALTCYTDALRLEPTDVRNYSNRVQVLKCLRDGDPGKYGKDYESAVAALEDAARRLPPVTEPSSW